MLRKRCSSQDSPSGASTFLFTPPQPFPWPLTVPGRLPVPGSSQALCRLQGCHQPGALLLPTSASCRWEVLQGSPCSCGYEWAACQHPGLPESSGWVVKRKDFTGTGPPTEQPPQRGHESSWLGSPCMLGLLHGRAGHHRKARRQKVGGAGPGIAGGKKPSPFCHLGCRFKIPRAALPTAGDNCAHIHWAL